MKKIVMLLAVVFLFAGCANDQSLAVDTAEKFIKSLISGDHETISALLSEPHESLESGQLPMFTFEGLEEVQRVGENEFQVTFLLKADDIGVNFRLTVINVDDSWKVTPDIKMTQSLEISEP